MTMSNKLVYIDDIFTRAHDVTLEGGAKHRCFDVTLLHELNTVELIRCKDCKYWLPHSQFGFDEENGEYHDYCGRLVPDDEYYAFTRNADEFCSRAERREDGERSES